MVLVGHAQRVSQPLTRLQRWLIAAVVIAVVGGSAWAITQAASAPVSHGGCVNVVVPSSTGGGGFSYCGAPARRWCATEYAESDRLAKLAVVQCRLAGIARASRPH
jgi:hypothetical protein